MENGIKVVLPLFNTEQRTAIKSGSIEYNLEGKYTKLTGSVGIDDKTKNSNALGTLKIIGDGKELTVLGNLKGGDLPKNIDIDITNISKLQISFTRDDNGELIIDLVDAKLY
ncbi:NPCBM/NEW2 domain-containing protein [Paenibacillus sp. RC67]|uniref:NPCBM/NEW2 domain-containing protein n=1 Tax=Paenibacillus sp. RC67 TaxID=3039392 RepID=UPI0024AD3C0C|nr:NPCBM/NEW2 domain-containing protein [Paenibacillus sp. RC67]